MYSIAQVWAWGGLLITQVFLWSPCVNERFTICGKISTVWIPGNRSEHFLSRWDLILLGDFFCFRNTGRQLSQTIPNKPQRKSDVFVQLCLMTILLLPAWLSSSHTAPKMELEILLWNVTADLWIIVFAAILCSDRGMLVSQTAWIHDIPGGLSHLRGLDQTACCLWTSASPPCIPPVK